MTLSFPPVCVSVAVMDGALSVCVLPPRSGGAVDQEDVGAAERPRAAGCWEEPGWSWSHVQGTARPNPNVRPQRLTDMRRFRAVPLSDRQVSHFRKPAFLQASPTVHCIGMFNKPQKSKDKNSKQESKQPTRSSPSQFEPPRPPLLERSPSAHSPVWVQGLRVDIGIDPNTQTWVDPGRMSPLPFKSDLTMTSLSCPFFESSSC